MTKIGRVQGCGSVLRLLFISFIFFCGMQAARGRNVSKGE